MTELPKLHFTNGAKFSCHSCGKCCTSGFEIPLQEQKVAQIEKSGTYRALVREGYQPLRVVFDDVRHLNYDESAKCYFFQQNLCALHKNESLSHKPVICRLYPYNLVQAPDGVHVSLLFSCPSVVRGEGSPLEKSRDGLHELLASENVPMLGPVQGHILVTQQSTVTWPEYLALERGLRRHVKVDDPVSFLLNAAIQLATPRPTQARFDRASEQLEAVLRGPFREFASSVSAWLEGEEEEALIPLLCPKSDKVKEIIGRFLQNQFEGKLLIVGPSLVARLVLLACAMSILLCRLKDESVEDSFAYIEERMVSQSNELEPILLEFEEFLLEG